MAHLSLALLGPFQIALNGQPAAALTAPRLQALLAYLAVEAGRAHSRAALAGLFWPERPDRDALSALRFALSNLRRAIETPSSPPCLLITRHTAQFNPAGPYRLDVDDFAAAAHETTTPEQLAAAIALYRGEFLAGLALGDSPAFEEWLLLKREQYHRQALTFLQQLAAHHEQRGEYEPAIARVKQALALEPWQEAEHRRLMRLLTLNGQRSTALAQYETCRQILAAELGVGPEDDTTRLYERIRASALTPPRPQPDSSAAEVIPPPVAGLFVGREAELVRLQQPLGLALAGQGRVVFVCGEAGSGKTTLLAEFVRRALATQPDSLFAVGRGMAQAGRGDPLLIFRDILGQLTGLLNPDWGGAIGHALWRQQQVAARPVVLEALLKAGPALLDTLLPGEALAQRLAGQGDWSARLAAALAARRAQPPRPDQPENLFEQVTRLLVSVAADYPLLLVLDDLQWADPDSLSLLFHLGRRLGRSRILVAGAYRPADLAMTPGERHPLQAIVNEFQREWGAPVIDLEQAEGYAFVNAYLDSEPNRLDDRFRTSLCRIVGGNPLFTVELVHRLQEQGDLTRDTSGHWVIGPGLDWQRLPARVEAVIAERLERLPAEWRALLAVASVAGVEFAAELVAGVLAVEERQVLRVLSGPLSKQQRLVQPAGPGQTAAGRRLSGYRFRHGLFQHYLYHTLDEAERADLHEAVGNQLEILHRDQATELSPRLAWHFEAAGRLERAAAYYLSAGQYAYRLSAHKEAIDHYRRGLGLLKQLPPPANPGQQQARLQQELALQLGLAPPLGAMLGWANPEQVSTYKRAYDVAHQLAGQSQVTPEFLLAFYGQITMATAQSELGQALTLSADLLSLAQQTQHPLGLALAHAGLGASHLFRGECALGRTHLEEAVTIYFDHLAKNVNVNAPDIGVTCPTWLALDLCFLGYPRESQARGREAVALARRLDTSLGMAISIGVCSPHICWRQPQVVQKIAAELQTFAAEKDLTPLRAWLEIALGWCQVEAGEFDPGLQRMERGVRVWQQMGTVMGHFWYLGLLAEAYGQAGHIERGLACIEEGLALVRRVGSSQYEPELHRIRGELLRRQPDTVAEAEQCFRQAIAIARRQETRWWELRALTGLARMLQGQDAVARREVAALLAELVAWFDPGLDLPDLREARMLLHRSSAPIP